MLRRGDDREEERARNPDRPSDSSSVVREESGTVRGMTRMTSPEKWEIKQLIAAGVLQKSDYPGTCTCTCTCTCIHVCTFCLAICFTMLASFFLPLHLPLNTCTCTCMYTRTFVYKFICLFGHCIRSFF